MDYTFRNINDRKWRIYCNDIDEIRQLAANLELTFQKLDKSRDILYVIILFML